MVKEQKTDHLQGVRPSTDHFIHVYFDDRGWLTVEWKCEADATADCRAHCSAVECEDGCQDYEAHRPSWLPNSDSITEEIYCGQMVYLEEGGTFDELYNGPSTDVRSGPIELDWDGHGYRWHYLGDQPR